MEQKMKLTYNAIDSDDKRHDMIVTLSEGAAIKIEYGLLTAIGKGKVTIESYFGIAEFYEGGQYIVDIPTYKAWNCEPEPTVSVEEVQTLLFDSVEQLSIEAEKDPCEVRGHAWRESGHDSQYDWLTCNRCGKRIKD